MILMVAVISMFIIVTVDWVANSQFIQDVQPYVLKVSLVVFFRLITHQTKAKIENPSTEYSVVTILSSLPKMMFR
jgi:hypothetical protein